MIRPAKPSDFSAIYAVINDGASAYNGIIPADCWHEPYMSESDLRAEISAGVQFSCYVDGEDVLGVMGIQDKGPVILIRHAYVRSSAQRRGIGAALLAALSQRTAKPVLIGTWKAATWAVDFYAKHGFTVLPDGHARTLLDKFWTVPVTQMETSVVLANEGFTGAPGQ